MRRTTTLLIGAGSAYFFDRRLGRSRRSRVRDQGRHLLRVFGRSGGRKLKRIEGRRRGLLAGMRRMAFHRTVDMSDGTVTQRIRSEALRSAGVSTRDIDVAVEDGVATLRGTVGNRKLADELVACVAKVPGVRDVAAILRVSASAS
ncbi:MAG: BON domain-containing protein [Gaiellaceae bacterium]